VIANKTVRRRKPKTGRNVRGNSRDPNRGTWCTSEDIAAAVGPFDVDPFSNPRSHIVSTYRCMLEDGGDGFGDGKTPGMFRDGAKHTHGHPFSIATERTRVFLQPDYLFVQRALDHYAHTRWCALLRFDPRPDWFKRVWRRTRLCCVLWRCDFEPPPGVTAPGSTFPHALLYSNPDDVTEAVLRRSIAWKVNRNGT
jgi:hypothetical protein